MRVPILLFVLLLSAESRAQYTFSGRIEYERKVNLHKLYDGEDWIKDNMKQPFYITYANLAFTERASRFGPGRDGPSTGMQWGLPQGTDNEVLQDYRQGHLTSKKTFYDESFLISDSLPKYTWRLLPEVRTIAGYNCRKAVTRVCDSVVVVAFYTDEIPVSGGPEQMGGLPGMILELAVPRLYTTWVATKVEAVAVKEEELKAPAKGKAVTMPQLVAKLQESMKDWGKYGVRVIWRGVL